MEDGGRDLCDDVVVEEQGGEGGEVGGGGGEVTESILGEAEFLEMGQTSNGIGKVEEASFG